MMLLPSATTPLFLAGTAMLSAAASASTVGFGRDTCCKDISGVLQHCGKPLVYPPGIRSDNITYTGQPVTLYADDGCNDNPVVVSGSSCVSLPWGADIRCLWIPCS